ncbi:phosphoglycerate mutase-like protein [Parathielavia appendiculata]|uniref:Phosphoglycerate mutase-like protein n=1 Tax=Parathielavia appendiculata TaxID=2587402 RepID=A0AAN6TS15_9PEZI|nr:phosphoglycerate mutase-like protein [Parathielavia appendiculata]
MVPKSTPIYLLRHAESTHNVSKDFNHRDPGLTEAGFAQAAALASTFPALSSISVILSSPLTRTIETTLTGFSTILFSEDSPNSAKLILDPDLQERSDLPCDTGSDVSVLEARFPGLDYSLLGEGWHAKTGAYAADDEAVAARAERVRRQLLGLAKQLEASSSEEKAVVVVTHGVFMKFLAEDESIDLPKAGWRAYTVEESIGRAVLRPL